MICWIRDVQGWVIKASMLYLIVISFKIHANHSHLDRQFLIHFVIVSGNSQSKAIFDRNPFCSIYSIYLSFYASVYQFRDLFTPSESSCKREKHQRTKKKSKNKKVFLRKNARGVPPAPYPVRCISCLARVGGVEGVWQGVPYSGPGEGRGGGGFHSAGICLNSSVILKSAF